MFPYNMDQVLIIGTGDISADLQRGYKALMEDMERFPSFDITAEYERKNDYFIRAQKIGHKFFHPGQYWAAEIYYRRMLAAILGFEESSTKRFNKGMAYANLAIAEMALGNFEVGIAHLLIAENEDKLIQPDYDILNSPLWHQFEKPHVFNYMMRLSNDKLQFTIDDPFITGLVTNLDKQDRIFFEGTFISILHNRAIEGQIPNSYSLGRLYSGLKDICLFTESLLRKHQKVTTSVGLLSLLRTALVDQRLTIHKRDAEKTWAGSLEDFLKQLEVLEDEPHLELRWLLYLLLIRNFTGHQFGVSDTEKSPRGKSFFPELFEVALQNVILALLYLKYIGALENPAT